MRTVNEHRAAVLALAAPLAPREFPLSEALGLVLAADVVARLDLPGFDNSAMDGYAVHAADVARASDATPVRLPVVADLAAGDAAERPLRAGEAIRIMTGAPLPEGADAVVKVEDTDGGMPAVAIRRGAAAGTSIRRRGEDLAAGGSVLRPGDRLDARRLALVAAAGHAHVSVHPRPRVAVVSTGAELIEPGTPPPDPAAGRIFDSNSHMLAAAVEAAGGVTAYRGSIGDDPEQVRALLTRLAAEVDVVVTSGGVSMGVHDVVKAVLRESAGPGRLLLGEVDFVQVAMQPGKPQGFGTLRGPGERQVPFFGLPGNPVSSYVSFEVFVRPLLRRLLGREPAVAPTVAARLATALRSPAGRRQIARATATWDAQAREWSVTPVAGQGSHFVADLAQADALVVIPEDVTHVPAGAVVETILLDPDGRSAG